MTDLEPCPFCNGTHSINVINFFTGDSFRKCDICGAEAPEAKTPEEAAKVWNTRPAEDAKDKEIEQLKKTIKEIRDIADKGLDMGIDFIGAGLDGMTGGVEDWQGMKRAKRKIRKLAKQALKKTTNAPDTGKMEEK